MGGKTLPGPSFSAIIFPFDLSFKHYLQRTADLADLNQIRALGSIVLRLTLKGISRLGQNTEV